MEIVEIPRNDSRYPALLANISDPPGRLYCRGNLALLDSFAVAVVGTRNVSDYGRQAARDIAGVLAGAGVTIVSGLALGVDAIAHRAALDASGATIAVLGSGVDDATLGPPTNRRLAAEILAHAGLIVSEYPAGYPADKWTFPMRNRIISGLCRGTLVVEADRKSGSLITATQALDQNRDVFAVPGSIYWPRSVGTNWLIGQGARLVMHAGDILECYKLRQVPLPEQASSTGDPAQERILALLRQQGPTQLDAIIAASDLQPSRVMAAVSLLELKDIIRHHGAGVYAII